MELWGKLWNAKEVLNIHKQKAPIRHIYTESASQKDTILVKYLGKWFEYSLETTVTRKASKNGRLFHWQIHNLDIPTRRFVQIDVDDDAVWETPTSSTEAIVRCVRDAWSVSFTDG